MATLPPRCIAVRGDHDAVCHVFLAEGDDQVVLGVEVATPDGLMTAAFGLRAARELRDGLALVVSSLEAPGASPVALKAGPEDELGPARRPEGASPTPATPPFGGDRSQGDHLTYLMSNGLTDSAPVNNTIGVPETTPHLGEAKE